MAASQSEKLKNVTKVVAVFLEVLSMSAWIGMAMDSLKFYPGLPCLTFYALQAGDP
jgi:hypothetical protein